MKLSEAILKGCELAPEQCVGSFIQFSLNDGYMACAVGAAGLAVTGRGADFVEIYRAITDWRNVIAAIDKHLLTDIYARNDAGESRESIAAWLAEKGL